MYIKNKTNLTIMFTIIIIIDCLFSKWKQNYINARNYHVESYNRPTHWLPTTTLDEDPPQWRRHVDSPRHHVHVRSHVCHPSSLYLGFPAAHRWVF